MATVKVSSKNQIAVPAAVRRRLGIKAGDRLRIEVRGQRAIMEREAEAEAASVVDELLAIAPEMWRGVDGQAYIDELRDEWSTQS